MSETAELPFIPAPDLALSEASTLMTIEALAAALTAPAVTPVAAPDAWSVACAEITANPDRARADPALARALGLSPPEHARHTLAGNVVEFGPAALSRLEAARARESSARQEVEALARANFIAQTETHLAVLELLGARNNADLAWRVDEAAQSRFGLAAGTVCVEGFGAPAGWRGVRQGFIDLLLGDAATRFGLATARDELFGPAASKVKSMALVRIAVFAPERPGVLAFGSPEPEGFTREMGGELVAFLGRIVERVAERWPLA